MYETEKETKIKEYINNYLSELQRQFDVSDKCMRLLLFSVYKQKSPISKMKLLAKKYMSMVKSFYKNKGKDNANNSL